MQRLWSVGVLALVFALIGCGSDSTPVAPPTVDILTKESGDNQQILPDQTTMAPLVVAVTSAKGDPVPGVKVNWGIIVGGGSLSSSSSLTDQAGKATVNWTAGTVGPQSVKAWLDEDGSQSVTFSTVRVVPVLSAVSGDAQSGVANQPLPAPLVVSVATQLGAPLANVKVNWGVTDGGGKLSSQVSTTDQNGKASVTWTLGPNPTQTVWVWTNAEGSQGVKFTATVPATAPAPTHVVVMHYDGSSWSPSMFSVTSTRTMLSVWAASPTTAFAGSNGCSPQPIFTYSNGQWTSDSTCTGAPFAVSSITGDAPDDGYAVGTEPGRPTPVPRPGSYIYRYDGHSWGVTHENSVNGQPLPDLHAICLRPDNYVVAVGLGGFIVREVGPTWTPEPSGTTQNLLGVWCDANSTDVFAVGNAGTVLRFNGSSWETQTSGTTQNLAGVWAFSPTNVYAVGDNGTIIHYDGTSWTSQSSGTTQNLKGIWGSSPNSIFAVGSGSTVLHYDGSRWTAQTVNTQINFTAVSGTSDTNVFASGG